MREQCAPGSLLLPLQSLGTRLQPKSPVRNLVILSLTGLQILGALPLNIHTFLFFYSVGSSRESNKKKANHRKQRAGSSVGDSATNNVEYQSNIQSLSDELEKEKPSRKTVRKLMKDTFTGRRGWLLADSPPVTEVVEVFPPIKQVKFVSLPYLVMHTCMQIYFMLSSLQTCFRHVNRWSLFWFFHLVAYTVKKRVHHQHL